MHGPYIRGRLIAGDVCVIRCIDLEAFSRNGFNVFGINYVDRFCFSERRDKFNGLLFVSDYN